jgi:pimeloyl-ACP methyl ester carboxylesterase
MPQSNDITYTYTGAVDRETRKFNLVRDDVLENVFAGGNWPDIIRNNGTRVDVPLQGDDIQPFSGATIDGCKVQITIQNDNNIDLIGGYYKISGGSAGNLCVIVFSGSGGSPEQYCKDIIGGYFRDEYRPYIKGVLCVDYRGFGCSRHTPYPSSKTYVPSQDYMPGSKGLYTDAMAMIAFAEAKLGVKKKHIILHGYSLGSGPATEMAVRYSDIGGLVLHGPMQSVYYQGREALSHDVVNYLTLSISSRLGGAIAHGNIGFDNIKKITNVKSPVLITSGPQDTMWIPAQHLYKKLLKKHGTFKRVVLAEHPGEHLVTGIPFECLSSAQKIQTFLEQRSNAARLNIVKIN